MNGLQQPRDLDPATGARPDDPGPDRRPLALPFPEGPPLFSLLVAGLISFVILAMSPLYVIPAFDLLQVIDDGEIGPLYLALPTTLIPTVTGALLGSIVLSVITMAVVMSERWRSFPDWCPYVVSLPIAWLLILPSKLELGGPWIAWLIFGTLVALLFCIHWRAFTWARTIWD